MGYKRVLLTRWSRRDRLAVGIIAVAVAFLVGTTLLLTAAGAQTTQLAEEHQTGQVVTEYDSVSAARATAPADGVVLPFTRVTDASGQPRLVVARPPADSQSAIATDETGVSLGTISAPEQRTLTPIAGSGQPVTTQVQPGQRTVFPDRWYVASRTTVDRLGATGALVITPTSSPAPPVGVPLRNALAFFLFGTRGTLQLLGGTVAASGLLIGVVVFSIARMTVRDRAATIQVVRATGGSRQAIIRVFAIRSGLLSLVGTALGYALGVIGVNAAINAAVFFGLPTTLDVTLSQQAARVIGPIILVVVGIGMLSGAGAAWLLVRGPIVGDHSRPESEFLIAARIPSFVRPNILDWRAFIPTAVTLTVFIVFVILVAGMVGVVSPLTASSGATITEPDAPHPVASTVPESYATGLQRDGVAASGEILTFAVDDGQPYTVRGVNYTAFQSVSDVRLTAGRQPATPQEAVIGADLRQTLGVELNDTITVGGLTSDKLDRVEIVGVVKGPGLSDDQLLVTLPVARHLTDKPSGTVQFIQASKLPESTRQSTVRITGVSGPTVVPPNSTITASVSVRNTQATEVSRSVTIRFANQTQTRQLRVPAGDTRSVSVQFAAPGPGQYTISAGDAQQPVEVAPKDALRFGSLPTVAPPNATVLVGMQSPYGDPQPNVTLTTAESQAVTGPDGTARVTLSASGVTTIRANTTGADRQATVSIRPNASRTVIGSVTVTPATPDVLTAPSAELTLFNPWGTRLTRTVQVTAPGVDTQQTIRLAPSETKRVTVPLAEQPPGTYQVTVITNQTQLASTSVRVTGDERIATVLATGGQQGQTGIGRAIETVFGNLQIVLSVITGFAGLMTVGGVTAVFAQAVHARRQALGVYRATGAPPTRVARVVLIDSIKIGVAATTTALFGAGLSLWVVDALNLATVYGVRILALPSGWLLAAVIVSAVGITLVGAALVVGRFILVSPLRLLKSPESGSEADTD